MEPHLLTIAQVLKQLTTNIDTGLNEQEVKKRLNQYGANVLTQKPLKSWLRVFLGQFQSPLIYVLVIAAIIVFILESNNKDLIVIGVVIFFNALIGTIQEGRTRNILASLKKLIATDCFVIRDGKKILISDHELVPGDIILLQEGQRVPADGRILETNFLQVDQAILTGESLPVLKISEIVEDEAPLADRSNMIYKGTYIMSGSGKAIVVATGDQTQIGIINKTAQEIQSPLPLAKEMQQLSYWILIFIAVFCVLLFVIGFINGQPLEQLFITLSALFVSVVPEGLPIVLTLVLVQGVYRMAKKNMLVKQMQTVEALGRTDIIIVDKTGTLTLNEMVVTTVFSNHNFYSVSGYGYQEKGEVVDQKNNQAVAENDLLKVGISSYVLNTAHIYLQEGSKSFIVKGDPTEAALSVLAKKLKIDHQTVSEYKKIFEIPFTSDLRYHAAFFEKNGKGIAFINGSPELLFKNALDISSTLTHALDTMLDQGLRVVAFAVKEFDLPAQKDMQDLARYFKAMIKDLKIIGLAGMQDSIRPDIKESIEKERHAGLKVVMATGDHKKTALYVAEKVGIFRAGDRVLDGTELQHMSDEEFIRTINTVTVYARLSPDNKLRLIKMFHRLGKTVAMTGDGINDVPALVAADIGIAMGQIGTEVAKESADMILLDDSLASIVSGIKEGRHIFNSLRRVILYFFATNMAEMLLILFALSLRLPLPLAAAQILWLNLVTDGFLDIALAMEPYEARLLKKKKHLIDLSLLEKVIFMAFPMAFGSIWLFHLYQCLDPLKAQTVTLTAMAVYQWFNAWNCRSETISIFQSGLFSNRWLIAATLLVFVLQMILIYVPLMQSIFNTVSLSSDDWIRIGIVTIPLLFIEEIRKLIMRVKKIWLH
jgi:Ca2+-transporting ATPase